MPHYSQNHSTADRGLVCDVLVQQKGSRTLGTQMHGSKVRVPRGVPEEQFENPRPGRSICGAAEALGHRLRQQPAPRSAGRRPAACFLHSSICRTLAAVKNAGGQGLEAFWGVQGGGAALHPLTHRPGLPTPPEN